MANFLFSWLCTDGGATHGIAITVAFAVTITFTNADNGFTPVGRRNALSWFAFRSGARDCANL